MNGKIMSFNAPCIAALQSVTARRVKSGMYAEDPSIYEMHSGCAKKQYRLHQCVAHALILRTNAELNYNVLGPMQN
jgi:hypothetical protein